MVTDILTIIDICYAVGLFGCSQLLRSQITWPKT